MGNRQIKVIKGTAYSILILAGLAHLLNDMMQSVIPAIYPIIKESFSLSFTQIGIINLVYQLTSSLLQPFVGFYIDKRKRPYLLVMGMMATLAGLLTLSVANNFATILLAVSLVGSGSSVFHPGAARLAQVASGGRKGLAQSFFQVGGNSGTAFGPLLAAMIILPYGQVAVSWLSLLAVLGIAVLYRAGRWYEYHDEAPKEKMPATLKGGVVLTHRKIAWAFVALAVLVFSKYFYIACITNYFIFYLIEQFNLTVQQGQLGLFAFLAASAIGTLIGGAIGDRYGRKLVIVASILGAAPFALMLPYAGLAMCIALAVIIGFVISSAFSAIVVYATDMLPTHVGVISGAFYGLMFGLGGIASALLGYVADHTSIEYIFQITSFLPLLGVVALWLPNVRNARHATRSTK